METEDIIRKTRPGTVLDVGCHGWRLEKICQEVGCELIGADTTEPPGRPRWSRFVRMAGVNIDTPGECLKADLVVANNHVLEHMIDPVGFAVTLCHHTRPGGHVWIEAPSEQSAQLPASGAVEKNAFSNFWDDPTHVRPWTPGALYRLALSVRLLPIAVERSQTGGIPVVQLLAYKPLDGDMYRAQSRYVTLRDVPAGAQEAFKAVWGMVPMVGKQYAGPLNADQP